MREKQYETAVSHYAIGNQPEQTLKVDGKGGAGSNLNRGGAPR